MKPIDHATLAEGAVRLNPPLVVHVVRQFLPNRGGLEDVVYNLARQSMRHGYRARVVTLNSLFTDREKLLPESETIDGIEVVRIPWRGSSRYPLAPSVVSHIRDADIVHVHAIDFFFDFLAMTRSLHGKTMIATTHGGFFHTRRFAAIKKVWFRTLTRFSASRYQAIVGCSRSDVETFSTIAPHRTMLIENGADTEKFAGASSPEPRKRVVTIGRFSVNKRLERLVDVMAELCRRDPAWHLDIIGVPSDLSLSDLESLIADRGLSGHVMPHIGLANDEIRRLLGRASIFASASDYEGFGLVAIEAMSAGLVPVLEGNAAYRALAERHRDIRISDFADIDGCVGAIEGAHAALFDDNDLRARLTKAAADYSWGSVVQRYLAAYASSIG
ncbi:MAG: glycosyltransferase family 4 protein [Rhizobiaceae bacterium]|nr:glycosyltransferase family 4 protein [Rhizobiaceae bacterium]